MSKPKKQCESDIIVVACGQWQPGTVGPQESTSGAESFEHWEWDDLFEMLRNVETQIVARCLDQKAKSIIEGANIPAVWGMAIDDPIGCHEQLEVYAKSLGDNGKWETEWEEVDMHGHWVEGFKETMWDHLRDAETVEEARDYLDKIEFGPDEEDCPEELRYETVRWSLRKDTVAAISDAYKALHASLLELLDQEVGS